MSNMYVMHSRWSVNGSNEYITIISPQLASTTIAIITICKRDANSAFLAPKQESPLRIPNTAPKIVTFPYQMPFKSPPLSAAKAAFHGAKRIRLRAMGTLEGSLSNLLVFYERERGSKGLSNLLKVCTSIMRTLTSKCPTQQASASPVLTVYCNPFGLFFGCNWLLQVNW